VCVARGASFVRVCALRVLVVWSKKSIGIHQPPGGWEFDSHTFHVCSDWTEPRGGWFIEVLLVFCEFRSSSSSSGREKWFVLFGGEKN